MDKPIDIERELYRICKRLRRRPLLRRGAWIITNEELDARIARYEHQPQSPALLAKEDPK